MKTALLVSALSALTAVACLAGCSRQSEPSADAFGPALQSYLNQRGDLCLGKTTWPIDLTQHEIDTGARNALQMPALERLGLVRSTVAHVVVDDEGAQHPMDVRRYALTEAGTKFYMEREGKKPGSKAGDFCAAHLSLDKVVNWTAQGSSYLVSYTYQVKAAPWTADAEIQKVFPMVAGVIQGAGKRQLQEAFVQDAHGRWVAADLMPKS